MFDVYVAHVDIDADTLAANRHIPSWPPTGGEMEDRIEDSIGYFLPSGMLEGDFPEKLEGIPPEIQNQMKEIRININTGYPESSTQQLLGKVKITIPEGIAIYNNQGNKVSNGEFDFYHAAFSRSWRLVTNRQFTQAGHIQMEFLWKEDFRGKGANFKAKDQILVVPLNGSIRFIRQNNTPIPQQGDEACLMISKRKTDIDINTPNTANFEGPAPENPDPDTFRLEVLGLPPGLNPKPEVHVEYIDREGSLDSKKYETVEGTCDNVPVYRSKLHIRLVSTAADDIILTGPPDGWDQTLRVKLGDWIAGGVKLDGQNAGGTSIGLPIGRPPQEDGPNAIRTAELRFIVLEEEIPEDHIQDATQYTTDVWGQAGIRFNIVEQLNKQPVRNILSVKGTALETKTISITVENKQVTLNVQQGEALASIATRLATAITQ